MKKIILAFSMVVLSSCSNNTPKCDDKNVTQTVIAIVLQNRDILRTNTGWSVQLDSRNMKLSNIITNSSDDKLQSCGCEATIKSEGKINYESNISYFAQKNSNGESIVKVEDVGEFNITGGTNYRK